MHEFEIEYFEKIDGTRPAEEFILAQDVKTRAKILRTLQILSERGNSLREPYSKELEDGILEIRSKVGTDIARILYFFVIGRKIILTNGFIKKTQKTPRKEISLAKKYREEYKRRQ